MKPEYGKGSAREQLESSIRRLNNVSPDEFMVDVATTIAIELQELLKDRRTTTNERAEAIWTIGYAHWLADLQSFDKVPAWSLMSISAIMNPHEPKYAIGVASEIVESFGPSASVSVTAIPPLLDYLEGSHSLSDEQVRVIHKLRDRLAGR